MPITTKLNSYDERLDSAADIAITDMLVRNFVALICHDLVENDPSVIALEQECHGECSRERSNKDTKNVLQYIQREYVKRKKRN